MEKSKEPIRLRQREMASGNTSLYLDIYVGGRRSYEYLHMYLIPEKTRADRDKNRATLQLAEAVRAKRVVELRNGIYGFQSKFATNTRFFDYYKAMVEKRVGSHGNWGNWQACLYHLERYERRKDITFADITTEWVQGFRDYLDSYAKAWHHDGRKRTTEKPLAQNSKVSYFNKLRACINQAVEDGILPVSPLRGVEASLREVGKAAQILRQCNVPERKCMELAPIKQLEDEYSKAGYSIGGFNESSMKSNMSMWELHNSITQYASHTTDWGENDSRRTSLMMLVMKLLMAKRDIKEYVSIF